MKLKEAVALITGGAMGMGRTFSKKLLEKGTKVIVADMNSDAGYKFQEAARAKYGADALTFLKCNVTDSKELNDTFDKAKSTFGRLDIVCNNAGIMTTDPERAKMQVDLNLTAVIEGTYKAIELMTRRGKPGNGGVIINVGAAAGVDLIINAAVFSATKHAVVQFSRSFEKLPMFHDVRVNCLAPYFCETGMLAKAIEENPENEIAIRNIGIVSIEDVGEGFMKCVVNDDVNAGVVVIAPNHQIFEMSFGPRMQ